MSHIDAQCLANFLLGHTRIALIMPYDASPASQFSLIDFAMKRKYHYGISRAGGLYMGDDKTREQLEEEVELLQNQLRAIMGENREIGVLTAQGMTQRQATILHILVKRAPAIVSRQTLHLLFYGDRSDGGPEPKIFDVQVSRIRQIFVRERRLTGKVIGKIDTIWNAGYRASPELVSWAHGLYSSNIPQEK